MVDPNHIGETGVVKARLSRISSKYWGEPQAPQPRIYRCSEWVRLRSEIGAVLLEKLQVPHSLQCAFKKGPHSCLCCWFSRSRARTDSGSKFSRRSASRLLPTVQPTVAAAVGFLPFPLGWLH